MTSPSPTDINYQKRAFLPHLIARLERKSTLANGCRVWQGSTGRGGYGLTKAGNVQRYVHRIAWELRHGPVPPGMLVLHHCDNPPCFQTDPSDEYPDGHLFLGTNKDNTQDMIAKGRAAERTLYGAAKLTREQRDAIRARRAAGAKVADVAREFAVSKNTVTSLTNYRTWWIDKPTEIVASQVEQLGDAQGDDLKFAD